MNVETVTFSDLMARGLLDVGDGYRAKNDELGGSGPVFLRSAYLQDSGFVFGIPERFKSTIAKNFGKKVSRIGDVVVTTKGNSVGRVGCIREAQAGAVYSPHLSYWRSLDASRIDQSFLFYWSRSKEFRTQLAGMSASTDMAPYFSLRDQARLLISLPAIHAQRAAAKILGALDDKIDLNRRMNETLEATARAIFKDWFIDFGPTHAKMEGRSPYLSPELWSLFPDCMDDDGMPKGWSLATLSVYATLNPESWSQSNYPHSIEYIDLSGTKWGVVGAIEHFERHAAPSRAQRIIRAGDTIVGTVRPGNGSFALVSRNGLTASTGFAVLRPRETVYREFVYFAATQQDNIDRLAHLADGGAYPAVRPEIVFATGVAASGRHNVQSFSATVKHLVDRMIYNDAESRMLSTTRDLLLPKLMSGELRVQDAERVVGALV